VASSERSLVGRSYDEDTGRRMATAIRQIAPALHNNHSPHLPRRRRRTETDSEANCTPIQTGRWPHSEWVQRSRSEKRCANIVGIVVRTELLDRIQTAGYTSADCVCYSFLQLHRSVVDGCRCSTAEARPDRPTNGRPRRGWLLVMGKLENIGGISSGFHSDIDTTEQRRANRSHAIVVVGPNSCF